MSDVRSKEEILQEETNGTYKVFDYLVLEVLCDIRDVLTKILYKN